MCVFQFAFCNLSIAADEWRAIPVPGAWEQVGGDRFADLDGYAWYRCFVKLPAEWKGRRLLLTAKRIDDVDEGYVNGRRVGSHGSMPPIYQPPSSAVRQPYVIDPDLVRFGEWNLIAFRVYDAGGRGGIEQGPIRLIGGDEAIDLSGVWQFSAGDSAVWAEWPTQPGTGEARAAVEQYLAAAGDKAAGHLGIAKLDDATQRETVMAAIDRFKSYTHPNARTDDKGKPLPPDQALAALRPADDLVIDLVAHEPDVAQPIHVAFDERGRMWVTQYIQYPNPAGLEVVSYDEHLRAVYDKVPPPPPGNTGAFRGKDKVTIHEDADGGGTFESVKTFLDGLNIATATARGRGGVWVLNPPYLLFYPDADNNDVPDADPVAHLSGFGLEDTHAVANSLTWGPDGWLYGGTGSTTTARVRVHLDAEHAPVAFLGQAIWRYHPTQYVFELFSEGGYNTFGVDFDDAGRVYSGTNASPRGVHFVQEGYYKKGFGKHGPLTNPYAFGYLDAMPHEGDQTRLTHQFIIDGGAALPQRYRGKMLAVNSLANWVVATRLDPWGSTFKTVDELKVITTDDKWFRPVHIATGPDGAAYISDWYDARITHLDPKDTWDHDRGRIYRLRAKDAAQAGPVLDPEARTRRESAKVRVPNLGALPSDQLVDTLAHPIRWRRATALRVLADRQDKSIVPRLRQIVATETGQQSLEATWALYQLGAFDETLSLSLLDHGNEYVRMWAVRLIGDTNQPPPPAVVDRLAQLACKEPSVHVRSQLASTAKRLPGEHGLRIVRGLVDRDEDAADPYLPLQLWWAVEDKAESQRQAVALLFSTPDAWERKLVRDTLMPRLARRYAAKATEENQRSLAGLIAAAPGDSERRALLMGMSEAFEGRRIDGLTPDLLSAMRRAGGDYEQMPTALLALAVRSGDSAARDYTLRLAANNDPAAEAKRIEALTLLGQVGAEEAKPLLLDTAAASPSPAARRAALRSLGRFSDDALGEKIADLYAKLPAGQSVRPAAIGVLTSRGAWAAAMLRAIESGAIPKADVPAEQVELLRKSPDPTLAAAVEKVFGEAVQPTSEEKQKEVERLAAVIAAGKGDVAAGKPFFTALCARCHTLHGEGVSVGPDLTVAKRDDLNELLLSIVDPSAGIHEDFTAYLLTLADGRQLIGFITDRQPSHLKVKDPAGVEATVPLEQVRSEQALPTSLMPENLLAPLTDQQARDLMAYLMSKSP